MEEYRSNSHKSREKNNEPTRSEKKIEKVITGSAKIKKKSGIRKFSDVFISEDAGNVKSYIFMDVLLPAAKKLVSDVITNGIDMLLYGDTGRNKRGSAASKVSYDRYYDKHDDRRRERNSYSNRTGYDYDDIVFDKRGDAEAVLDTMYDILDHYGVVSIGDLYEAAEISTHNYTNNKYGWLDLRGASIARTRDGYLIKLPRALPLD